MGFFLLVGRLGEKGEGDTRELKCYESCIIYGGRTYCCNKNRGITEISFISSPGLIVSLFCFSFSFRNWGIARTPIGFTLYFTKRIQKTILFSHSKNNFPIISKYMFTKTVLMKETRKERKWFSIDSHIILQQWYDGEDWTKTHAEDLWNGAID